MVEAVCSADRHRVGSDGERENGNSLGIWNLYDQTAARGDRQDKGRHGAAGSVVSPSGRLGGIRMQANPAEIRFHSC